MSCGANIYIVLINNNQGSNVSTAEKEQKVIL